MNRQQMVDRRGRGRQLPRLLYCAVVIGLAALSLQPLLDRALARHEVEQQAAAAGQAVALAGTAADRAVSAAVGQFSAAGRSLLQLGTRHQGLASWDNVGGCGAGGGGASSTSGGAKWVGRGVRGGRLDVQCISSQTFAPNSALFTTINTRVGSGALLEKWSFAVNVPLVYKRQPLEVVGERTVALSGFGDLSLELTRKLGITNTSSATLLVSLPAGAPDAVREGVVLPQHLQLGSGVVGVTGLFEHTADFDGGLLVLGGSFTWGGWENSLKDYRAPAVASWIYVGYLLGPFVPSAGLSLSAKFGHDREGDRDEVELDLRDSKPLLDVPIGTATASVGLEWSTDWLALLLAVSAPFSSEGPESLTVSLGVSSSLF